MGFMIGRLGQTLIVLLVAALVSFMLFRYVGDPVNNMVGQAASLADREAMRTQLGLNDPVAGLLLQRLPATFELSLVSILLAAGLGVPLGVWTALHPRSPSAKLLMLASLAGVALPPFLIARRLILVFSVWLGWLPSFGRGEVVSFGAWTTGLLTASGLKALVLPSVTLGLFQMTLIMRLVRAEMQEVLRSDFIRFAPARGLKRATANYAHGF